MTSGAFTSFNRDPKLERQGGESLRTFQLMERQVGVVKVETSQDTGCDAEEERPLRRPPGICRAQPRSLMLLLLLLTAGPSA